jgi:hypothetical protein
MNKRVGDDHRRRKLVQAQVVSGLSVERFCRVKKICKTSFYAWRKRFGIAPKSAAHTLPTAMIINKDVPAKNFSEGFMRIIPPAPETIPLCIETNNGYKINIGYGGKDGLKYLLQLLRSL